MKYDINCLECEGSRTVYHLDWTALLCSCGAEIENPYTTELYQAIERLESFYSMIEVIKSGQHLRGGPVSRVRFRNRYEGLLFHLRSDWPEEVFPTFARAFEYSLPEDFLPYLKDSE